MLAKKLTEDTKEEKISLKLLENNRRGYMINWNAVDNI